jgi:hypothetical protein
MDAKWSEAELRAMQSDGSWYKGSAVCRRGHVETAYIDPQKADRAISENCPACGASVLTACQSCRLRIRGYYYVPGVFPSLASPARPSFCDGCGSAFPWASREERIYELENLLDEADIDEADMVIIQDQLARLRASSLSNKDEKQAWETIKRRAGGAIKSPAVERVVEGLVSAAIRRQLGL